MVPVGTRFLIVDDFETVRQSVMRTLDDLAISGDYLQAENIEDAKKLLKQQQEAGEEVGFIICDWNMPGGNGIDLLHWVRADDSFDAVPFMMLTTENEAAKVLDAIEAGVDNYCIKPWKTPDFLSRLNASWEKRLE